MAAIANNRQFTTPILPGGAPVNANELVNILQNNQSIEVFNFFESLLDTSGNTEEFSGGLPIKTIKNGISLAQPTIDLSIPTSAVVGPFSYYVDGKVIYHVGGTFDLSSSGGTTNVILMGADSGAIEQKTFNDGISRDLFVKYEGTTAPTTQTSSVGTRIPEGVNLSNQYVILSSTGVTPTAADSLGITESVAKISVLEEKTTFGEWQDMTISGSVSVDRSFQARKRGDGLIQWRGRGTFTSNGGTDNIGGVPSGFQPSRTSDFLNFVPNDGEASLRTGLIQFRNVIEVRTTTAVAGIVIFDGIEYY